MGAAQLTMDITEDDIARLVPAFYARIREDAVLGPIFNGAIDDWPHHLGKLQAFWSSVMLTSGRYKGQPMVAHVRHEPHMTRENFGRWLALWRQTSAELLGPEKAAAFQEKADRIAESLQLGVQFYRERKPA
jgi:hemoglobin